MNGAHRPDALRIAGWAAFAVALGYFGAAAVMGLTRIEFGDETEKFVAALMQREGGRLYRDVFTHHGPLSYVLPHALVALLGPSAGIRATRVAVALVTASAAASLAASPALRGRGPRALAAGAFLGLLAPVWLLQALNLGLYHNLAGALAVAVLAQFTAPALLGVTVGAGRALAAGFAAGLVPFAAYSHGPAAVLLGLSGVAALAAEGGGRAALRTGIALAAGALGAAALTFAWLARFGDVGAFFAYSFLFNQRVYGRFIEFGWTLPLETVRRLLSPEVAVRSLAAAAAAAGLAGVAAAGGAGAGGRAVRALALLLLAAGLLLLNPRGGYGFAANALVLAGFALLALGAGALAAGAGRLRARPVAAFAVAACALFASEAVSRVAVSSPNSQRREELVHHRAVFEWPRTAREELIQAMADPSERILALVYRPHLYLEAGRLPAASQYYFLPWQAAYERSPVPGYELDLCRDLRDRAPPVVFFDDWLVWGRYRFAEYAPCVAALLDERYVPAALDSQVRIRRDRLVERWRPDLGLVPATRAARDGLAGHLPGLTALRLELAASPGSCLAVPDEEAAGAPLEIRDCELAASRWHALDAGAGELFLVGGAGALCAGVRDGEVDGGALPAALPCTGGPHQRFTVVPGARGTALRAKESGACLAPGASGAVEVRLCEVDGGPWRVSDPAAALAR